MPARFTAPLAKLFHWVNRNTRDGSRRNIAAHYHLSNDFFANLLDMRTVWNKSSQDEDIFEGHDRESGELKYTATSVDLAFGANSQLRALAEVYASDDGKQRFVEDFVAAWNKVMMLDRFEIGDRVSAEGHITCGVCRVS